MYKYVIWDFDGTVFDTYPHSSKVFKEELEKYGIYEDFETVDSLSKVSFGHLCTYLLNKYPDFNREKYAAIGKINREDEPGKVFAFPGAKELCEDIVKAGGENWMYSHRGPTAKTLMKEAGMLDLFKDFVLDGDGFPWKPAPDAVLALLERNGADKKDAIMVGDREIDCGSGYNAGIDSCLFMATSYENTKSKYQATNFDELRKIIFGEVK